MSTQANDPGLIYRQHDAAFKAVSAFAILDKDGSHVGNVSIKFPTGGLRLWAYVHLIGLPMVRASAGGGGYDKTSAAVADAIRKIAPAHTGDQEHHATLNARAEAWREAVRHCDSTGWARALDAAGFAILNVI